jgi:type IV pilus assembly protein PilA
MKKGFTLVEMLAVVVILGLVLVVAIPQIQNEVSNKKSSIQEATLTMIYNAAELYTSADPSTFKKEAGTVYCIQLQDLVDAGKIEAPIKNFNDGTELDLSYSIKIETNSYLEFEYTLIENSTCPAS